MKRLFPALPTELHSLVRSLQIVEVAGFEARDPGVPIPK